MTKQAIPGFVIGVMPAEPGWELSCSQATIGLIPRMQIIEIIPFAFIALASFILVETGE